MSMFRTMNISASGLQAGRVRMEVIAQNIANAETDLEGATPYRRKEVVMVAQPWTGRVGAGSRRTAVDGGVQVLRVQEDQNPPQLVYRPGDPAANAQGYVRLPSVNLPMEMVDMVAATRAYEANAAALKAGRDMGKRTLDIMR